MRIVLEAGIKLANESAIRLKILCLLAKVDAFPGWGSVEGQRTPAFSGNQYKKVRREIE
ncbi:MAG TPA: hypothetical protein VJW95_01720 [Dissulfurispiraceae bacterium]|nr:hypothetical protein [Dissulfurispiraceae bacterium]